jgi:hypothetical protein
MKIINAFFNNQICNLVKHNCYIKSLDGSLIITIRGGSHKDIKIDDIKSTGYKKIAFFGKSKSGKNKLFIKHNIKKLDDLLYYPISEGFLLLCKDETNDEILSFIKNKH